MFEGKRKMHDLIAARKLYGIEWRGNTLNHIIIHVKLKNPRGI
ncbi:hypothetical protein SAMN05518856_103248 [Paenibacillus sp. OK003]|nr:hypothetical protein SAMN05518856_103248 [Paenibacillus sp. OK003]